MDHLEYENHDIATVTGLKLSGKDGLGVSVLVVQVDAILQPLQAVPSPPPPRIIALGGQIIGLGVLAAQNLQWECASYAQRRLASLEVFLSGAQVRALEEARDGKGELTLTLSLEAMVSGRSGIHPSMLNMPVRITGSDWSRLLAEMKFEDRATFEVPVGGARVGPPLDRAAAFVKSALDRVQHRQWADALVQCREALDELEKHEPAKVPAWRDWADGTKREAWDMRERLVAARASVRHMTHTGPHCVIGNADEHAVRLAVTMTAALLRYHATQSLPWR